MQYKQYEELCRLFVANEENIPIEKIKSDYIPSSVRPGLEEYKNQIDLYWELEDKLTRNLVIVNAKWRSSDEDKVVQGDILLIQQVKQEIDANKAMIITNTGFTDGARKAAINRRIALHIVVPNFDSTILHTKDRLTMQTQLQELFDSRRPVYSHVEVNKTVDPVKDTTVQSPNPDKTSAYSQKIAQTPLNKVVKQGLNRRASSNLQKVQGSSGTGKQGTSQTGQQGGPPSGSQGGRPSGRQGGSGPSKGSGSTRGGGGTSNRSR